MSVYLQTFSNFCVILLTFFNIFLSIWLCYSFSKPISCSVYSLYFGYFSSGWKNHILNPSYWLVSFLFKLLCPERLKFFFRSYLMQFRFCYLLKILDSFFTVTCLFEDFLVCTFSLLILWRSSMFHNIVRTFPKWKIR